MDFFLSENNFYLLSPAGTHCEREFRVTLGLEMNSCLSLDCKQPEDWAEFVMVVGRSMTNA
jgi:hypothetical protein